MEYLTPGPAWILGDEGGRFNVHLLQGPEESDDYEIIVGSVKK